MRTLPASLVLLLMAPASACHRDIASLDPHFEVAQPLRPRFAPPEDSLLTETVTSALGPDGAPDAQRAELTTVTHFTPEEGTWRLTQRVTHSRYTRDGAPVTSLVDTVLARVPVQWRLSADGTYLGLVEPGAALEAVQRLAPAGADATALARFFAPEALDERLRGEWEVKYGGLYGRTLAPGQRGYAVGRQPLGGTEVTYLLERTFTGTRPTEQGEALIFALRCLAAPGDTSPQAVRDTLSAAGEPEVTPGVECDGEQWIARGRFLPLRRTFTLRAQVGAQTWTWTTDTRLRSLQAREEDTP